MLNVVFLASIFLFTGTAVAADIDVYGAFNYKLSNDENTSGASYSKLEDNGSKLGLDISEPIADGQSLNAFAKIIVLKKVLSGLDIHLLSLIFFLSRQDKFLTHISLRNIDKNIPSKKSNATLGSITSQKFTNLFLFCFENVFKFLGIL